MNFLEPTCHARTLGRDVAIVESRRCRVIFYRRGKIRVKIIHRVCLRYFGEKMREEIEEEEMKLSRDR